MLVEIHVRDLGVIEDLDLLIGPGMTALTGETGAGKTLVVEALELLVGGRADATLVRGGAECAVVEGRFVAPPATLGPGGSKGAESSEDSEIVVRREIPASGRSRAYVDGHMATVAALESLGSVLVDLHGQHAHQSLLHAPAQRQALDHFGAVDLSEADEGESALQRSIAGSPSSVGTAASSLRETDLLRFQIGEIETAQLDDPDEERRDFEAEEAQVLSAAEPCALQARPPGSC